MNEMIQTQHLCFAYGQSEAFSEAPAPARMVLQDISLSIERGSFTAVLGHNGCGKSTLAKHFNAILLPSGGKVYVDGIDTAIEDKIFDVRQRVGMVFQNPDNQIVATIVEEDVAFGPENLGIPRKELRSRVDEALEAVGMTEYKDKAPHQLSGGQKQRVAIAGIIAMRPDCIVLDEPTAMLDPRGRREVIATIRRLNQEYVITVVLITHYMDEAAQADRVLVFDDGKPILDGTAREVFSHVSILKQVGLDVPQTTELLYQLQKSGVQTPHDVLRVDACADAVARLFQSAGVPRGAAPQADAAETRPETPHQNESGVPAIQTVHLTHTYGAGTSLAKNAIEDVNLSIEKGALVGVIGHTGSGKSTLISHLNGLLKPIKGEIYIDGENLWQNPKDIRRFRFKVGLVFQYPEYQLFEETVYRDISFGPRNMGLSESEIDEAVREAARFVGIADELLDASPFELSGGQKRRVAIAGVIAMHPDILILDEPTAGLDPKGRDRILRQIKEYHAERGNTILLISHSMEDVAKFADRVLVMNQAQVAMYDTTENVFRHAREIEQMGLSIPQITKVFHRLAEQGWPVRPGVFTVESAKREILNALSRGER